MGGHLSLTRVELSVHLAGEDGHQRDDASFLQHGQTDEREQLQLPLGESKWMGDERKEKSEVDF
jgi:hypothetical protein